MLAAGAHAFLRGGGALVGALLDAGKDVLELHHAGIGEHQCRVVARHQRRRRHDFVALGREIIQKCRPDLVNAAHLVQSRLARRRISHDPPKRSGLARSCAINDLERGRTQNRIRFCRPRFTAPLLDGGRGAVQKVCSGSGACRTSTRPVDICCGCVDSHGNAVFFSYLFKTVTSGEIGFGRRRRRSNRPGNSQANGPRDLIASGKRRRRA